MKRDARFRRHQSRRAEKARRKRLWKLTEETLVSIFVVHDPKEKRFGIGYWLKENADA